MRLGAILFLIFVSGCSAGDDNTNATEQVSLPKVTLQAVRYDDVIAAVNALDTDPGNLSVTGAPGTDDGSSIAYVHSSVAMWTIAYGRDKVVRKISLNGPVSSECNDYRQLPDALERILQSAVENKDDRATVMKGADDAWHRRVGKNLTLHGGEVSVVGGCSPAVVIDWQNG